jgi:hypothetical protein
VTPPLTITQVEVICSKESILRYEVGYILVWFSRLLHLIWTPCTDWVIVLVSQTDVCTVFVMQSPFILLVICSEAEMELHKEVKDAGPLLFVSTDVVVVELSTGSTSTYTVSFRYSDMGFQKTPMEYPSTMHPGVHALVNWASVNEELIRSHPVA